MSPEVRFKRAQQMIGGPKIPFLLIDFPSDHEVDRYLLTESQVIKSLLSNGGRRARLLRCSTTQRFDDAAWKPMPYVTYVHVGGHGSKSGIELIGGRVSWSVLAKRLRAVAPPLTNRQQRILTISRCHSAVAFETLEKGLRGHFTGCYRLNRVSPGFDDAMTVWVMFYRRKTLERPHGAIIERINKFFARRKDILVFERIAGAR